MKRRTKIICTIGPAVSSPEMLRSLVESGMDVARLNFSHGNHPDFDRIIKELRAIEDEIGRPIGILADIQGPKIRVGDLPGKSLELVAGEDVWMVTAGTSVPAGEKAIPTTYKEFCKDVSIGNSILLDDGLIQLRVIDKIGGKLKCQVQNGGTLFEHKGINVPDTTFSVHAITEKDYADILFCVKAGVDFIALSFVRSAQEIRHLKSFLVSRDSRVKVLAKIEKREAIACLDEIIDTSDGILVARGDLAVEVGAHRVPVLQKKIVRRCNIKGKSVIIATQMLMSMVSNPTPTRAEASDVANAIVDGTDAIMLSNETAVGKYPLEAVQMMNRIAVEMEIQPRRQAILYNEWELGAEGQKAIALLQSAVRLASIVGAGALVVVSRYGISSLLISKCRPESRVVSLTGNIDTYRQLSLHWGVDPVFVENLAEIATRATVLEDLADLLIERRCLKPRDTAVMTAGLPQVIDQPVNTIKVVQR